ncbi:MAG TPA: phosphatidylglycerophosphatase A [Pyrinomonadaceae bacterium]|jgi:phosphatidylglycerophosphatase A|nr:phosphatidylglycerophosphatase A [Pyrinomonadaceae bacterium]
MKVVKESSDELNPTVLTTARIARAPRERTAGDYVALALATCGVGLLPFAPGTWGSLVGVGLYLLARAASAGVFARAAGTGWGAAQFEALQSAALLVLLCAVTLAGVWAATRAESLLGRKDPGAVVIDEVAGQLITFAFVPFKSGAWVVAVGFVLFRLFDIWKPYPVRRLEALESGLGIMADDVLAGFYAATVLALVTSVSLLL